jgi:hypothetical protein
MEEKRDSFVFFRSFLEAIEDLDAEDFKETVLAISKYALDREETDCKGVSKAIFSLAKPVIDSNHQRWLNSKKGGRPKKPNENQIKTERKPKQNQTETKTKPKYNQTETKLKPNENQIKTKVIPNVDVDVNVNVDEKADVDVTVYEDEKEDVVKKKPTRKNHEQINSEIFNQLVGGYDFSENMRAKVYDWFMYKAEMKKDFKERGAKSLFTEILNNVNIYGEQVVIEAINRTMSNGYQGIVWDYCKNAGKQNRRFINQTAQELNDFYEMSSNWAESEE